MRLVLFAALLLASATPLVAQAPPAAIARERAELSKLDFILGTWKGSGWMMLSPGQKAQFNQTEIIQRKVDGSLITIEGDGRDAANPDRHIHSAFATVYLDQASGQIRFTAFSGGNRLDVPAVIGDKTIQWGFEMPQGRIRYTMDFTTGQWHETGEFSSDGGKTWSKNFEMTLTRS